MAWTYLHKRPQNFEVEANERNNIYWINVARGDDMIIVFFEDIHEMKEFVEAQAIAVNKLLEERANGETKEL
jgi:hypothetical protein